MKRRLADPACYPLVMGILNATPDSFSDGGKYQTVDAALVHARSMVAAGADFIDMGGESTRPGAMPVSADEQIARVIPLLRAVRSEMSAPISIDTTQSSVAEAALDAGANLINDVSAGRDDPKMLPLAAARRVPIILMHMRATPATMQDNPMYADVVTEVKQFLQERLRFAESTGINRADVLLDPGIGFGKTVQQNLELLSRMNELAAIGCPLVIGTSRKGFIGQITGEAADRIFGTAATIAWAAANGAAVVRVHDVAAMTKVATMIRAIRNASTVGLPPTAAI